MPQANRTVASCRTELAIALVKLDRLDEAREVYARVEASGRAIGGLALMQKPEHRQMVEECLAVAAEG